ncbi:MAG: hypothetical protein U0R52_06260 [Solirubrobacterales bacterium]
MDYPLENALFQWEEGWRSLERLHGDPRARRAADRLMAAVTDELRRRIGSTFRAAELADLYARGTDWCQAAAAEAVQDPPLDPQSLVDAAFWAYLRGASDFAGGRQTTVGA